MGPILGMPVPRRWMSIFIFVAKGALMENFLNWQSLLQATNRMTFECDLRERAGVEATSDFVEKRLWFASFAGKDKFYTREGARREAKPFSAGQRPKFGSKITRKHQKTEPKPGLSVQVKNYQKKLGNLETFSLYFAFVTFLFNSFVFLIPLEQFLARARGLNLRKLLISFFEQPYWIIIPLGLSDFWGSFDPKLGIFLACIKDLDFKRVINAIRCSFSKLRFCCNSQQPRLVDETSFAGTKKKTRIEAW